MKEFIKQINSLASGSDLNITIHGKNYNCRFIISNPSMSEFLDEHGILIIGDTDTELFIPSNSSIFQYKDCDDIISEIYVNEDTDIQIIFRQNV